SCSACSSSRRSRPSRAPRPRRRGAATTTRSSAMSRVGSGAGSRPVSESDSPGRLGRYVRPRRLLPLILATALFALGAVACEDDGTGGDADADGTTVGIDREAVLGELAQVRNLFVEQSPLDGEVLADV